MHNIHMDSMKLSREDFELVVAIHQSGTVTGAAQRLNLSQSALSHHLRALEGRLGEPLFLRYPRKMVPTLLGAEFAASGKQLALKFQEAEQRISSHVKSHPKVVRIATECYTNYFWLPSFIQRHNIAGGRTELRIIMEATSHVREALDEGDIDVAIVSSSTKTDNLQLWPLFRDEVVLVVAKEHPLAREKHIRPKSLTDATVIVHTAPGIRNEFVDDFLLPYQIQTKSIMHVPLSEAIVEMVSAGLGVSPFARWLIEPYMNTRSLCLLSIGSKGAHRDWQLAARQNDPRTREFATLAKTLRASFLRQRS